MAPLSEWISQIAYDKHPLFGHIASISQLKSRNSFLKSTAILANHPKLETTKMWTETDTTDYDRHKEVLPCGQNLPWKVWRKFNRLRTWATRCKANLKKWGTEKTDKCNCGEIQTCDRSELVVHPLGMFSFYCVHSIFSIFFVLIFIRHSTFCL